MNCQKVYPSEKSKLLSKIQKSQLLWPFYSEHSRAKKVFLQEIMNGHAWQIKENERVVSFLCFSRVKPGEPLIVTNALFLDSQMGWKQSLLHLEKVAKKRFCSEIVFDFSGDSLQLKFLIEQGYHRTGTQFQKELSYHTALVLGGGGAHGSYQIGVWQALKELGITFELVTGTSVGALNGAFVLQDDIEVAKKMWQSLSTEAVMSFPAAARNNQTIRELIWQIASLTTTAIRQKGVSTQPLRKLLEAAIRQDKIESSPIRLFVVATEMSALKETVVEINKVKPDQRVEWLLASASFFPAMQATEIDTFSYMDGGYRNNLPVDVAIQNGATEYIAIDIKGPGITKHTRLPETVVSTSLHSPWELGTFLVFDATRSQQNLQLGYLETLKKFGQLKGYWYAFEQTKDIEILWTDFWRTIQKKGYFKEKNLMEKNILPKLRKLYKDRVTIETMGLAFIELAAKSFQLLPTKVYTINQLKEEMKGKQQQPQSNELGVLSVQEWLDRFKEETYVFSERNQLRSLKKVLLETEVLSKKPQDIQKIVQRQPIQLLLVLFIDYLMEGTTW